MYLFIVNLNETTSDEMMFGCIVFSYRYDLTESSWYNTLSLLIFVSTHHRVRFTASCLPVGKDRTIITIKNRLDERKCTVLVDG